MNWVILAEWLGCWTGLAGAALLATNMRYSYYGWIFFLISNISWITFAAMTDIASIGVQHIGFMATSILGTYRWIIVGSTNQLDKSRMR